MILSSPLAMGCFRSVQEKQAGAPHYASQSCLPHCLSPREPTPLLNVRLCPWLGNSNVFCESRSDMQSLSLFTTPPPPLLLASSWLFHLSGKVLELNVWKSPTLFSNLQPRGSQWRVNEAFLTHLSRKRMQPHHLPLKLSLTVPTNGLRLPDQSLDEGCLQCGPEIQKSFGCHLGKGIPDLQNSVWEKGVGHGMLISGPQRGRCRNREAVFGNPIIKARGLNNRKWFYIFYIFVF